MSSLGALGYAPAAPAATAPMAPLAAPTPALAAPRSDLYAPLGIALAPIPALASPWAASAPTVSATAPMQAPAPVAAPPATDGVFTRLMTSLSSLWTRPAAPAPEPTWETPASGLDKVRGVPYWLNEKYRSLFATVFRSDPLAAKRQQVVAEARKHLGIPYVWGGETTRGFDCSGLMQYVYRQFGVKIPRVAADQAKAGEAVSRWQLQPGDMVFFKGTRGKDPNHVTHVGMYVGNGKMLHAPKTGDVVKIVDLDAPFYQKHWAGARRVLR